MIDKLIRPILLAALAAMTMLAAVETIGLHGFAITLPLVGTLGWPGALDRAAAAEQARDVAEANFKTAESNVMALSAAVARQNVALAALAKEAEERRARAAAAVKNAQESARQARARLAAVVIHPPQGATACDRVMDIDRRFLEALQ